MDVIGHAVGRILGVFYVDDGLLGLRDLYCLQVASNVHIGLFHIVGFAANVYKLKNMDFQLEYI